MIITFRREEDERYLKYSETSMKLSDDDREDDDGSDDDSDE